MGIKGEEERGQTARQPGRTHRRQQAAGQGRTSGGEERGADGLAPGEWRRQEEYGSRERADRQKKRYDIFKEEKREKNAAETRKSV